MLLTEQYFTISQLNELIKEVLNSGFPESIWICGEIQGYDRNKHKKHVFFDLCEENEVTKEIMARIGLVIFSGRKIHIEQTLQKAENAFDLKDGIQVKLLCKIDFYPPHGAVRLIIEGIDPVYTLGKIAQEKQRLIALLRKKGILDRNKKLEMPIVPLQIGLITSENSAAYKDFLSEFQTSGYAFKIYLKNTIMQGKNAEGDICGSIDALGSKALDVIVITRGGGSIADLSCFDSQAIAERIAACSVPVLSGIGHEIDLSVTDLAAHSFEKTPTAIAQFLINKVSDFLDGLEEKVQTIIDSFIEMAGDKKVRLRTLAVKLQSGTLQYLQIHRQILLVFTEDIKRQPAVILREGQKHHHNLIAHRKQR